MLNCNYGDLFCFLEIITEMHSSYEPTLSLKEFKDLIYDVKDQYKIINQSASKSFIALNIKNNSSYLCSTYYSIKDYKKINCDRG